MHFVYVLLSEIDKEFYIGLTKNIDERIKSHQSGSVDSTKQRRPLKLIYYEFYCDEDDARGREIFLKSGSGHRFLEKQLKNYLGKNRGT